MRRPVFLAALGLFALTFGSLPALPAHADPSGDAARSIVDKYKDAVVTFTVVIKMSGGPGGDEGNQELEAQGFLIDPSGLIVTTNAAIDPASFYTSMLGSDSDSPLAKITSKVVSVRVLGKDGDEIPAKVVLRDSDRNLAFIRLLTPPSPPATAIDLKAAGKAQIGESVYILGRMGKTGNRGPQIGFTRVTGTVERPRLLYVVQPLSGVGSPGNLVFNEQGQPLGLLNFKVSQSRRGSFGFGGGDAIQIVIPADDVLEDGLQAPQVKDVKDTDTGASETPAKKAAPAPTPPPGKKKPAK